METPSKAGRPPHVPTDTSRKQVEAMASYGVPQADISKVLGIAEKTLRKHYHDVLEVAEIKANTVVAQRLYSKTNGDGASAVTACIFWLKTRAGWREPPQAHELSGPNGAPIQSEVFQKMSDDDLAKLESILAKVIDEPE